ncbi:MAG: hypothetical protein AAGG01_00920 [Planctomycetota bacterium]
MRPLSISVIAFAALAHAAPGWASPRLRRIQPRPVQAENAPVSVSSSGVFGDNSSFQSQLSDDGRFIVFDSFSDNLAGGDANGFSDVFRRDLELGTTELVSQTAAGTGSGSGLSLEPDVSSDGQLIVWASQASDLVAGDNNGTWDVFLRNMASGMTERLSNGAGAAASSGEAPRISPDGRFVVFESDAAFVPTDVNGLRDVYRLDRQTGTFVLVSVTAAGVQGDGPSTQPDVSDDGSRVVFASAAGNFAAGDQNGLRDVFVKDLITGTLELVSRTSAGIPGNDESQLARISGNGETIAFNSRAGDLVLPDANGNYDVYALELGTGILERLNVRPDGSQPFGFSRSRLGVSRDGQRVVFTSVSSDLVAGDTNGAQDVFLRDRAAGTTERFSLDPNGAELFEDSFVPAMTDDARVISFASDAGNVTPGNAFGERQVYARVRFPGGGLGSTYCLSNPNSTGAVATTRAEGSAALLDNDLTLVASSLPRLSFTFFITSQTEGFAANPGGSQGNICLGGSVGRYVGPGQVQNSGVAGTISLDLDLAAIPQPLGPVAGVAGETWRFQAWFRDSLAGQPTSNFTNGYAVLLR